MNIKLFNPPRHLRHLISFYWTLDGIHPNCCNTNAHRTMANYKPELFFHYGNHFQEINENKKNRIYTSGLLAQANKVKHFHIENKVGIFSIVLHPYAIPILFNFSTANITNGLIDLNALLGFEGENLTEKIIRAENTEKRIEIFNEWILSKSTNIKRPEIIYAAQQIYKQNGMVDVKDIAQKANLSQRQFERVFKEYNGFSPKSFSRLVRFNKLARFHTQEKKTLTQLAYDFGYFDQSHFIEEFKTFSGYTPNTYFSGGATDVFFAPCKE